MTGAREMDRYAITADDGSQTLDLATAPTIAEAIRVFRSIPGSEDVYDRQERRFITTDEWLEHWTAA